MDLKKARQKLSSGNYTCVLCHDESIYTSTQRGVAPLLDLIDSGVDVTGFSAADKVVGKATALLYLYLGVTALYAQVISAPAVEILSCIRLEYDWQVPFIRNRDGTGCCPMELAAENIDDPQQILSAVRCALKKQRSNQHDTL